jgi:cytochrome c553
MRMPKLAWLIAAWPLLSFAAPSARQELASVLASRPDAARGTEVFASCAVCHGPDGNGAIEGTVPRIAGQHYRVLADQIVDFRHGKRWDFRMEGVGTRHQVLAGAQDIADVAWFVSQMERDGARGVGDGLQVELGATLFSKHCASCHGRNAEGDDKRAVPRLAGQHAAYLSRQIYDAVDGRRPRLAKSHGEVFAPLVFDQVLGISDYLARVGWKVGPPAETSGSARPAPDKPQ